MSLYTPNTWVMLKFTNTSNGVAVYKILAGWSGSYLYGASWKLNSGVTKVERDGDFYLFSGSSGSVYKCHKNSYGLSAYTSGILESFYGQLVSVSDTKLECMDEDSTDFMSIDYASN